MIKNTAQRLLGLSLTLLALTGTNIAQAGVKHGDKFTAFSAACEDISHEGASYNVCQIFQAKGTEEGKPAISMGIGFPAKGDKPIVRFQVFYFDNFVLNLSVGLGLQIDDLQPMALPYNACSPTGCMATAPVEDDVISAMKEGSKLYVIALTEGGKRIRSELSLRGFTKGLEALRVAKPILPAN